MDELQSRATSLAQTADRLLGGVLARDDLHLTPERVSRAAYARALKGLRAIEAFVRRVLLMLALEYEHILDVDMSERPIREKRTRRTPQARSRFRIFENANVFPGHLSDAVFDQPESKAPDPAALYARTQRLRDLLKDPAARARRLAYILARKRHGPLLAPDPGETLRGFGTEGTTLFHALGSRITAASQARPPPKGPRPRPPPRIRQI